MHFFYSSIFATKWYMKHAIYRHFVVSNCLIWFGIVQLQTIHACYYIRNEWKLAFFCTNEKIHFHSTIGIFRSANTLCCHLSCFWSFENVFDLNVHGIHTLWKKMKQRNWSADHEAAQTDARSSSFVVTVPSSEGHRWCMSILQTCKTAIFILYLSETELWVKFVFFLYSSIFTTKWHEACHLPSLCDSLVLLNCLSWFAFVQFQTIHACCYIRNEWKFAFGREKKKQLSTVICFFHTTMRLCFVLFFVQMRRFTFTLELIFFAKQTR